MAKGLLLLGEGLLFKSVKPKAVALDA